MSFGEWAPGLTIDEVLTASDSMRQMRVVGEDVYWLAGVAAENSRGTIRRWHRDDIVDLTPEVNVRSRVNEYGGGAFDVDAEHLAFVDDVTRGVWVMTHGGSPVRVSPEDERFRYGGLRLASDFGYLLAVREDASAGSEPRTELVALALDEPNPDGGLVIATGADFYGRPAYLSGRLAWAQWHHPNMPWDSCEVWSGPIGFPSPAAHVDGGDGVSAVNPFFLFGGQLAWFSDESGFWNLTIDGDTFEDDHDFCPAPWTFEEPPIAQLDETTLIGTRFVDGFGRLVLIDLDSGTITEADLPTSEIESVAASEGIGYAICGWPDRPTSLVAFRGDDIVQLVGDDAPERATVPEALWFDGPAGPTQAWFYPVPLTEGDERPPLLVKTHGGPTGMARANLDATIQYWTGIGVAVLDVNYSGSAGFGREYRDRLQGRWGQLDVADCVAAVRALADADRIDPYRVAITGGSAGGYTTLQSLVTTDVYAAGMSLYGIGDLETMVTDTHKFESRYLDGLVGPYPEAKQRYISLSPVHHVDRLATPMLILQGLDDLVVPPNQAEAMADAVRTKGLPLALVMFEGEGHGFRNVATRRAALQAQLSFLAQVFGFTLHDDVPVLAIENLA